jgi:hypothetical protein
MQLQKIEPQSVSEGKHSLLHRACAFVGGSYFAVLLVALQLATVALSIGILIVGGPLPTPEPRPFDYSPWVWVSAASSTDVAITVRLFGGSDSLSICNKLPCSSSSAFRNIPVTVAADGSGLFKVTVGGLAQGTRYYYQVLPLPDTAMRKSPHSIGNRAGGRRHTHFWNLSHLSCSKNKFQICGCFLRVLSAESSCDACHR